MADETKREEAVRGLRELADAIEQNPEMPMPHFCEFGAIDVWAAVARGLKRGDDGEPIRDGEGNAILETELEFMARVARSVPGELRKGTENGENYLTLRRDFGPIKLVYSAAREEVCVRRQVGTEKRTKIETVKTREVEVEEPVYEWDCKPILSRVGK